MLRVKAQKCAKKHSKAKRCIGALALRCLGAKVKGAKAIRC